MWAFSKARENQPSRTRGGNEAGTGQLDFFSIGADARMFPKCIFQDLYLALLCNCLPGQPGALLTQQPGTAVLGLPDPTWRASPFGVKDMPHQTENWDIVKPPQWVPGN